MGEYKLCESTIIYLIPIKTAYHIQISGVGDSTVDDEDTIVDDGAKRQPTIYALDKFQQTFRIMLIKTNWQQIKISDAVEYARASLVRMYNKNNTLHMWRA